MPVAVVRSWSLEDQYRHIIALGKIGELMQQSVGKQTSGSKGGTNKVHIVNRGGRHVLV